MWETYLIFCYIKNNCGQCAWEGKERSTIESHISKLQVENWVISCYEEENIRLGALLGNSSRKILKVFFTFWCYKFSFGTRDICQKSKLWLYMYPREALLGGSMGYQCQGSIISWFKYENIVYLVIKNGLFVCL